MGLGYKKQKLHSHDDQRNEWMGERLQVAWMGGNMGCCRYIVVCCLGGGMSAGGYFWQMMIGEAVSMSRPCSVMVGECLR